MVHGLFQAAGLMWMYLCMTILLKRSKKNLVLMSLSYTVIAIQDREKHNQPVYAWKVCKVFALCSVVGGSFEENIEHPRVVIFLKRKLLN